EKPALRRSGGTGRFCQVSGFLRGCEMSIADKGPFKILIEPYRREHTEKDRSANHHWSASGGSRAGSKLSDGFHSRRDLASGINRTTSVSSALDCYNASGGVALQQFFST